MTLTTNALTHGTLTHGQLEIPEQDLAALTNEKKGHPLGYCSCCGRCCKSKVIAAAAGIFAFFAVAGKVLSDCQMATCNRIQSYTYAPLNPTIELAACLSSVVCVGAIASVCLYAIMVSKK